MSEKFVLNETSYFGKGAREELVGEIQKRGFKKVFLVSDKALVEAGVTSKVEEILNKGVDLEYAQFSISDLKGSDYYGFAYDDIYSQEIPLDNIPEKISFTDFKFAKDHEYNVQIFVEAKKAKDHRNHDPITDQPFSASKQILNKNPN